MASARSSQLMFQLKVDPLTGNSEWVVVEEGENDDQTHIPDLTTTSYLDMLNDTRRNKAFRLAIDKTIIKPCHVLDIGAGTGLLSMMAVRAMGVDDDDDDDSKGIVTACESYLPMVKLMRKVLRCNGMSGKVRTINKRSDELEVGKDIPSRADVLVSEILDSELLGEGLIPTLQHAHDNLLVQNPLTVPHRATVYGQLVECAYLQKLHGLAITGASDGIHLIPSERNAILSAKQKQLAMHCNAIEEEIKRLSEPFKVFDFDFWKRPDSYGETKLQVTATADGTVDAIISWWLLQLDSEGTIFYSTAPKWIVPAGAKDLYSISGTGSWCDHWKQCVWLIPDSGLPVHKDEAVHLHAVHSQTSISYEVRTSVRNKEIESHGVSNENFQVFLSPERIAMYGDDSYRCSLLKSVKKCLKHKASPSPLCLVADDSIFLAIAVAHLAKASKIISLFPGLQGKGAQYLQAVAAANDYRMDQIQVQNRDMQLTPDDFHQQKVDLLLAEPFYYGNDNVLPWQNLRFWKERTSLDPVLSRDVLVFPRKGILRACAMYLPDLWQSRRCLKEIEGFDHSIVNTTLGACGDLPPGEEIPCLPFFIWQCGNIKKVSDIITIMEFDFSSPTSPSSSTIQVKFTESGTCHGFVLWIDWLVDPEENIIVFTGPEKRYWKQAVKLLKEPLQVSCSNHSSTEIKVLFDPSSGDLKML